jgi:hypothetical protein
MARDRAAGASLKFFPQNDRVISCAPSKPRSLRLGWESTIPRHGPILATDRPLIANDAMNGAQLLLPQPTSLRKAH